MKAEFSIKFDSIFTEVESIRKDIMDCSKRVTQTEVRITSAEDDVTELQVKIKSLERKNQILEKVHNYWFLIKYIVYYKSKAFLFIFLVLFKQTLPVILNVGMNNF